MKWKYACPNCKAVLNPNVKIILKSRRGKQSGLMLISSRLGNYQTICDEQFGDKVQEGQLVEFSCPVCDAVLTSPASKKLAEILMYREGGDVKRIQFSRVYGEEATFMIDGDTVVPYGEDAAAYDEVNFFGC
ncbi:MAG: hypothetical protein ABIF77_10305 [bacterium]